jgi:hypothetical protein
VCERDGGREEPSCKLVTAMLAFVRAVAGVCGEVGERREEKTVRGRVRDLMCLATCCGRVKVAWQTEHLWSPAIII